MEVSNFSGSFGFVVTSKQCSSDVLLGDVLSELHHVASVVSVRGCSWSK